MEGTSISCAPLRLLDGTEEAQSMTEPWMAKGLCRSERPSTFFPSDGVGVEVARRICAECPVKAPCLEYALRNGIDHGVWGGTSERERRRIARRRRLAADALLEPVGEQS
jgi:WhiB family redox-sensing transcriptional regulator